MNAPASAPTQPPSISEELGEDGCDAQLLLSSSQLAASASGNGSLGFFVLDSADGAATCGEEMVQPRADGDKLSTCRQRTVFVRAMRIGAPRGGACGAMVEVEYKRAELPPSFGARLVVHAGDGGPARPRCLCRADQGEAAIEPGCSPQMLCAWAFSATLLWGSYFLLLCTLGHRQLLPSLLQGSALDEAAWFSDLAAAMSINAGYSLLLVDAVKVTALTLTSKAALSAFGVDEHSRLRMIAKPMRRIHKVLDLLL